MKLSDIGEEALIEHIAECFPLPKSGPGLVIGVGDDAAVLSGGDEYTIVTTDMLSEGMDFLFESITPYQLGWKSVAVNVSDIAAMGGIPTWTLVSMGFKPDTHVDFIDELYRGMIACTERFGSKLIGGDTNAVRGDAVISVTQMGKVKPENLARRSGARVGDRILVTGCLGDSIGGLELLFKFGIQKASEISGRLIEAHFMPVPRVPEANAVVSTHAVRSMMDLSDGLGADLPKLCKASGVGALVYAEKLPVSDDLRHAAEALGTSATNMSAGGGEDFELLMTCAPEDVGKIIDAVESETGTRVTEIGEIIEGPVKIVYPDGTRKPLTGGWEHFK